MPEERGWGFLHRGQQVAGDQEPGVAVRVGEGVNLPAQAIEVGGRVALMHDDVGLVEGLPPVERDGYQSQLAAELDVGEPTDPGGIKLAGHQERGDLLVRPAFHQGYRARQPAGEIAFERCEQVRVGIQEDRRQAEPQGKVAGRREGVRAADRRRTGGA